MVLLSSTSTGTRFTALQGNTSRLANLSPEQAQSWLFHRNDEPLAKQDNLQCLSKAKPLARVYSPSLAQPGTAPLSHTPVIPSHV